MFECNFQSVTKCCIFHVLYLTGLYVVYIILVLDAVSDPNIQMNVSSES